jgi:predicted nucleic acid-binding protein
MKSLDTNILLHAANEDCPEHPAALRLLDEALASPHDWILADQVLFEMYVGLRHPQVFAKPLSAGAALERVAFLRESIAAVAAVEDAINPGALALAAAGRDG